MGHGRLEHVAAVILLVSTASLLSAEATAQERPLRKLEIGKVTCHDLTTLTPRELYDRFLIYMNGYLDGTQKATVWDAEVVAKRIDEVERICKTNPKSPLLDAFKRAWSR